MSASREKKIRQERVSSGYVDPKLQKAQEEKSKQRRQNIIFAVAALAFVVCAIVLLLNNSKVFQRNAAAVRVDGTTYTAADLAYFFPSAYSTVMSTDEHADEIDTSKSLTEQTSPYDDGTWFDHIAAEAAKQLALAVRQSAAAKSANFDTSAAEADLSNVLESLRGYASSNGVSVNRYLQSNYGTLMTQKVFERNYRMAAIANAYATAYSEGLTFSDDELLAVYEGDTTASDSVDFDYVLVRSGAASDATDAEKTAATEKAHTLAETALARIAAGDAMEDIAADIENATYGHRAYARYSSSSDMLVWLFDDARKAGDTTVIDISSGTYALRFNSRSRSDEYPVTVRHILVADEAAANDALAQWQAGPATEESFAALATELSTDTGSSSNGGLYEDIYLGEMVEPFESWCFDPARKAGDTGIVQTDYGYHVMYYVGASEHMLWQEIALNQLRSEAVTEWAKQFTDAAAPEILSGAKNIIQ